MTCPELNRCDEAVRPNNTRPCNTHPCTGWVVGSWGQVSRWEKRGSSRMSSVLDQHHPHCTGAAPPRRSGLGGAVCPSHGFFTKNNR